MAIEELNVGALYNACDPASFDFKTTDELDSLEEIIGQPRAVEAVRFGVDIRREGYNIFVLGPPGTGKRSLIWQYLEGRAPEQPSPDDWCYVNNFEQSDRPVALRLPAGRGRALSLEVNRLLDDVPRALSAMFESDDYQERRRAVEQQFVEEQQRTEKEFEAQARENGLATVSTPQGFALVPADEEGNPLPPERVQELSEEERNKLEERAESLKQELRHILESAPRRGRERQRKVNELNRWMAAGVVRPLVADAREDYGDLPRVLAFLDAVEKDMIDNAEDLLRVGRHEDGGEQDQAKELLEAEPTADPDALLRRYRVNVIVSNDPDAGAPLVYEDNPTYPNLVGRIEYRARMGALLADFNLVKAGALHRANGGYLILDAHRVLAEPKVWDALKRAVHDGEVRIESLAHAMGLASTTSLDPEPIPLDVKVVLMGRPIFYHLLREHDPEFAELFKVPADFETDMDRSPEGQRLYARLIGTVARKEGLRPFGRDAVARVIEHSSRLAGDTQKLSIHMRSVADLLREADYWACEDGEGPVTQAHVDRAIEAQVYRSDRVLERIQEQIRRGTVLIDTEGNAVGQINGLAVFPFGDFYFGRPSRITARVRMGRGEVVDIEREVALGGPLHSKGVLTLAGFLTGRYANDKPLSLSASLVFEQSYSGIDGDSASSTELYALMSAIAEVPIRQSLAVTGSVNQHGRIQAIGGVNEKIEGFFDVCRVRGLTGEQGVLIPESNVQHLMLRGDVREAVEADRFHVYAVSTVDEGIALLTGMEAGEPDADGQYPPDSVNGRVARRLAELAEQRRRFAGAAGDDAGSS
ncbi:MAG: ATP-binding protein [Gemmatimonadota bacterium]|jgi:lon-related putative ATP-dependent protease